MAKSKELYAKSVELLNKAVADELSTIHQYMYFHFHCDDMGLDLLAALFHKTAIEEMRHVERMAERILFLKGEIEMKPGFAVKKERNPKKMLEIATQLETGSIRDYNDWANECAKHADSGTKKLFEDVVADEERHFGQYDTEMDNADRYGDNYFALQSIERSKTAAAPAAGAGKAKP